jgi:hypothetical protein
MATDLILLSPEKAIGRNCDQHQPPWLARAVALVQGPGVIVHVLKDIESTNEIERIVAKGQIAGSRSDYATDASPSGVLQCRALNVYPNSPPIR